MALLDAVRALTAFDPPSTLPECDLEELVHVLTAHGLAPLASYQVEHSRVGAGLPSSFREALLGQYQGVVNDNVLKYVGLRGSLRAVPDVPVILLEAAAYVDWLYPHMAFRPAGDLRIALRGEDGGRFGLEVGEAPTRRAAVVDEIPGSDLPRELPVEVELVLVDVGHLIH